MKIALLGPAHPFRGGIVHFNSMLAAVLQSRPSLTVDLFYWTKPYPYTLLPGSLSEFLDEKSSLTFHRPGLSILSYTSPWTWYTLIKILRRNRYDIFITHWVHPIHFPVFKILFTAVRLFTKTKIYLIVHNSLPHERVLGDAWMSSNLFKMTSKLIMHSQPETDWVNQSGAGSHSVVKAFHPLYNQFSPPRESREDIRQNLGLGHKVFLFFGFIRPYKGLDLLIRAFCELAPRHPDVSLLIVGEHFGHDRGQDITKDEFKDFAVADHIKSRIVWIDRYVANEEVSRYFVAADALVAPYLSVSQSGPLQIAYAFEKPVIASDLPAFRECVSHGESGYLFSTGSVSDLKSKMELFLQKPITAGQVRQYSQQFSWERYVDMALFSQNIEAS